jgi:hypothetical protein
MLNAVVLLTPDDVGFLKEKVCALKRASIESPSELAGVDWEKMNDSGAWRQSLAREMPDTQETGTMLCAVELRVEHVS